MHDGDRCRRQVVSITTPDRSDDVIARGQARDRQTRHTLRIHCGHAERLGAVLELNRHAGWYASSVAEAHTLPQVLALGRLSKG
jgi:hypothetical protein